MNNIILNTDSYKVTMWKQYPPKTVGVYSYIEARGGDYDKTVMFGMQMFLKEYLCKPITQGNIDEAVEFYKAHGVPFNEAGWQHILDEHKGYLPLEVKAVKEGLVVPIKNVLVTVENTDPKCFWLTTWIETALLRAIWYPTTVATVSYRIKQHIKRFMEDTGADMAGLPFKLHDFGARGVSSYESAGIGDAAHLVNFMGTDTVSGAWTAMKYYNCEMPGFSIPASEHSTITSWGVDKEADAYRNMIEQFKYNGMLAVVSDSYDIFNAADVIWGQELHDEVVESGAIVIIRPDSGEPIKVVSQLLEILAGRFGVTTNSLGYMLLNNVRIIQGDGIDENMIVAILSEAKRLGYSAENLAFGMGGALLQHMNRDTSQWAMKCSAIKVEGESEWRDVYKAPKTDLGKASKRGRLSLIKEPSGKILTVPEGYITLVDEDMLHTVFLDGRLINEISFDEVRANSEK